MSTPGTGGGFAGLGSRCEACAHVKVISSASGSRFLLCERSRTDANFPKYPPQPVLHCVGFEPRRG